MNIQHELHELHETLSDNAQEIANSSLSNKRELAALYSRRAEIFDKAGYSHLASCAYENRDFLASDSMGVLQFLKSFFLALRIVGRLCLLMFLIAVLVAWMLLRLEQPGSLGGLTGISGAFYLASLSLLSLSHEGLSPSTFVGKFMYLMLSGLGLLFVGVVVAAAIEAIKSVFNSGDTHG